jgi:hypothetical protein
MPALSNSDGSVVSRAVTVGDVMERRRSLRSWLIPPDGDFQLDGLTDIFKDATLLPPHTWLLGLSRHVAAELHNYSPRRKEGPPPPGFPAALDWHRPDCEVTSPWTHYLRVQRARDDSSQRFTAETDCNDFLIRPPRLAGKGPDLDRGSLSELQLFFCEFLAQRRGAIFASHVSERIYNVWLPPGVITLDESQDSRGPDWCFAVLPVVTVVRRPYRIDWRYALSVTVLFVPWWHADASGPGGSEPTGQGPPRAMGAREVVDVIASTSGNSTYLRDSGELKWTLSKASPLWPYLHQVTADDRRDFCHRYASPDRSDWDSQTLRQWIELLLMTVAELPIGREEREDDRLPEQQQADDRILPDEVLRCLRVNGIWSAMLLSDSFSPCTDSSRIADGRWWPQDVLPWPDHVDALTVAMPGPLGTVFRLFADRNRGFAPTPDDRVDGLAFGGRSYATWLVPGENIMITAYSLVDDNFPSFSSLYQVGWFAYMAVGVTCAWQTMYSLTHDTDRLRDVAELSQLGHNRIMDLEDVYEFDVAWPAYAQFYRRVRNLLGVDREYEEIKERLDILFRFAQAEQRAREEKLRNEEIGLGGEEQRLSLARSHVVEGAAAVVGAVILLVSLANVVVEVAHDFHSVIPNVASTASLVIAVVGIISFFALRSRVRKIDRDREKARAALARLAREPGTDSSRRGS